VLSWRELLETARVKYDQGQDVLESSRRAG